MQALESTPGRGIPGWRRQPWLQALWCMVAAFGTYACMYGFRKPFTAGSYDPAVFGVGFKTLLVTSQVLGYTLSKFIGIKVIAEMVPAQRAWTLLGLIAVAEVALVGFALMPPPYSAVFLFLNGLPLGMVFGLVLGFLEGRRLTEAFVAGLCASFILADGFTKSMGATLLAAGVSERWMPAVCGLLFALPLMGFVAMLQQIPRPSAEDEAARSARLPMDAGVRRQFFRKYAPGLLLITLAYLLITILRSLRADFAPELWRSLGTTGQPAVFTRSELWVALGVVVINGLACRIRDNRTAFLGSLALSGLGLLVLAGALAAFQWGRLPGFAFMVTVGLGLYIPYVAVHATVFERLIALTRERGNIGYLMYVADAAGYLGYVAVMLGRRVWSGEGDFLTFFTRISWVSAWVGLVALILAAAFFARRATVPNQATHVPTATILGRLRPVLISGAILALAAVLGRWGRIY